MSALLDRLLTVAAGLPVPVACVTVALADSRHEIRHPLARRAWFGPYARSDHQLLFPDCDKPQSVGLIPLVRQERLVGCLNLGSTVADGLLSLSRSNVPKRLGVVAAFALESTLNRARLLRSGYVDFLTGRHNQQYFQRRLHEEIARSEREQQAVACLLVDVDDFRAVNTRYGSEEFALLLPNTEIVAGQPLVERIRQVISASPIDLCSDQAVPISVSVGLAEHRPSPVGVDPKLAGSELVARAQLALFQAQAGRARGALNS